MQTHTVTIKSSAHKLLFGGLADVPFERKNFGRGYKATLELTDEQLSAMRSQFEEVVVNGNKRDSGAASEALESLPRPEPAPKKKAKKKAKEKARKLADVTDEAEACDVDYKQCPNCGIEAESIEAVATIFGYRKMTYKNGEKKMRPQSYCHKCKRANRKSSLAARKKVVGEKEHNWKDTAAELGYEVRPHEKVAISQRYDILKDGQIVFVGRAHEAWGWINEGCPAPAEAEEMSEDEIFGE